MATQKAGRELGIAIDPGKLRAWNRRHTHAEIGEAFTKIMKRLEQGDRQFALSFPFVSKIISRKRKVN